MATTPPAGERFRTLDIVRGAAVVGILVINILSFALPAAVRVVPTAAGPVSGADLLVWAVEWTAFESKMRGLFSLLFGASLLVVADRARAAGRGVWAVQGPRLAVLLALGIGHFVLLWEGDILILYALVGLVAVRFARATAERIWRGAVAALLLGGLVALSTGMTAFQAYERTAAESTAASRADALLVERRAHAAPYAEQVRRRSHALLERQVGSLVVYGPQTLGLMLLGMALLRSGLLTGQWTRPRATRLAGWSALAGGGPLALVAGALWLRDFPPGASAFAFHAVAYPFNMLATVAWAAMLCAWASGATGGLARALEAAGRMAFTNYIATSVAMTAIFSGWGLGLFGRVGRVETLAFLALGAALMLAWSRPWLSRFRYGPLEWLWRSAARGRLQPTAGGALAR